MEGRGSCWRILVAGLGNLKDEKPREGKGTAVCGKERGRQPLSQRKMGARDKPEGEEEGRAGGIRSRHTVGESASVGRGDQAKRRAVENKNSATLSKEVDGILRRRRFCCPGKVVQ